MKIGGGNATRIASVCLSDLQHPRHRLHDEKWVVYIPKIEGFVLVDLRTIWYVVHDYDRICIIILVNIFIMRWLIATHLKGTCNSHLADHIRQPEHSINDTFKTHCHTQTLSTTFTNQTPLQTWAGKLPAFIWGQNYIHFCVLCVLGLRYLASYHPTNLLLGKFLIFHVFVFV